MWAQAGSHIVFAHKVQQCFAIIVYEGIIADCGSYFLPSQMDSVKYISKRVLWESLNNVPATLESNTLFQLAGTAAHFGRYFMICSLAVNGLIELCLVPTLIYLMSTVFFPWIWKENIGMVYETLVGSDEKEQRW
ncbi:hypothetical protein AVEN_184786-1 [Araneus ventricosus]|uniref:Uncharacterized protein n=1 Tax=Araneus ventricosus TaxID=182803 RepID=A0A4Y2QXB4_ARAVE|nr:hypothetical protein AVEN_184786-1 [Araneus ventricosus]